MNHDDLTSYITDPNAHPLTYPVLGALAALLLVQLHKTAIIPWTAPAKWQPMIAYCSSFALVGAPMVLAGAPVLKALLSALFGSLMPMGAYSLLVRPVLASPPATVPPIGTRTETLRPPPMPPPEAS